MPKVTAKGRIICKLLLHVESFTVVERNDLEFQNNTIRIIIGNFSQ